MRLGEIAVVTGGVLTLLVSVGHVFFPRLFRWGGALDRLDPLNQRVLYTIHVALWLLLLPLAFVSLLHPGDLTRPSGMGGLLALGLAAFWVWRLVWQLLYFAPLLTQATAGWRGFHWALVVLFVTLAAAYGGPVGAAWLAAR